MKTLKEFRIQINEVLKASDPIEKWIDDFVHSKNPKFSGKSTKERIEMAKGAYYGAQKNESAAISQNSTAITDMNEDHLVHVNDGSKYDEQPHEKDVEHVMAGVKLHGGEHAGASDKGVFFKFKSPEHAQSFAQHVNKCPHRSCSADLTEAVEYKGIGTDVVDKKKKLNPQPNFTTTKKTVKDFKEDVDKGEYDYEGQMSRTQLQTTMRNCQDLIGMIKNDDNMPEWVQSKITLAQDYITTVRDYLQSKEELDEGKVYDPFTKKMVNTKPIKVQAGGGATRNGVPVETGPSKYKERPSRPGDIYGKSFTEETEQIDELDKKTIGSYAKKATKDLKWQQTMRPFDAKRISNREKGIDKAIDKLTKEDVQIDELSKGLVARYANKVAKTTQTNYDKSKDKFQFSSNRQDGMKNAVKRLTKEESEQVDESSLHRQHFQMVADLIKGHESAEKRKELAQHHAELFKKANPRFDHAKFMKAAGVNEEVQIDEVSKSTLMRYIPSAARDVGSYTHSGKEAGEHAAQHTRAGDWEAAEKKTKKSYADFKKANKRIAGIDLATKKLGIQKEEVELDEAIAKKLPVQHAVDAVHATLGPKSATRFLSHLSPGLEKHTSWDKVNDALVKQGVQTHHIAKIAQHTSHMNESRGHKVLATFFKNREVAQRAYQGNPAKDSEVAAGGGSPAEQGIAAAKKDAEEFKKKVNEATAGVSAKAPTVATAKKTKSTAKEYASASIPGTKRVTRAIPDNNEVGGAEGNQIKEDQYASDYKIKYYVDPITGENKTRKIRPHRVDFKNSKMRGEPAQADAQGDYGLKEDDKIYDEKWKKFNFKKNTKGAK